MKHRLVSLVNGRATWPVLALLFGVCLVLGVYAGGKPKLGNSDTGTENVGALELAGSSTRAKEVITNWDEKGLKGVAISAVHWDYAFLFAYSTALALACLVASKVYESASQRLAAAGFWIALAQWAAALLDAVENVALLRMLRGDASDFWAGLARACAIPKFALIALALVYAVSALSVWAVRKMLA